MKFEVDTYYLSYSKVIRRFDIILPDKRVIKIWKSSYFDDNNETDNDMGYETEGDKLIFNSLTEDEREEFYEYIDDLTI